MIAARDVRATYYMYRVVYLLVSPELALHVLVAQHAHLGRELLAMCAKDAAIQRYRGE